MVEIRDFASRYDFILVEDLGRADIASLPRLFFPGATLGGGRDGVSLLLNPNSPDSWIGTYAFENRNAFVCAATCPDPDMLLVVSGGAAYTTYPHDGSRWSRLPAILVGQIIPVLDYDLILVSEGRGLLALGASGILWRNLELSAGSTLIESINGTVAIGLAEDPAHESHQAPFSIDILTGQHEGGKAKGTPLNIQQSARDRAADWRSRKGP